MNTRRAIILILDSVGIGETEDSYQYGDCGCNTLQNVAQAVGGIQLPHLESLGLGKIEMIPGVSSSMTVEGAYGKMKPQSSGKDTVSGHWEMMGVILEHPFPVYPAGFPQELIREFEQEIGTKSLGNVAASGTAIIEELGQEHLETGFPIVYTSADSVFQVAAHEEIIPVAQLYRICETARNLLQGKHGVGRVIARPFSGVPGSFIRTPNRKDFSLLSPPNILDYVKTAGHNVVGIGKIKDIFGSRALSESFSARSNSEGVKILLEVLKNDFMGLVFINLLDFDQLYGHRNDPAGYARALEEFDQLLPDIMASLKQEDLLAITADHGCDPTTLSTDHTREFVPLLIGGPWIKADINLGVRKTFADLGQTMAEHLGVEISDLAGISFYKQLR